MSNVDQKRHQIVWTSKNSSWIVKVNFRLRQPCKIDRFQLCGCWAWPSCHVSQNWDWKPLTLNNEVITTGCRYTRADQPRLSTIELTVVFVGHAFVSDGRMPPCFIKRREERKRKKEKFYIYLDVTHTHTRPEPGQPWKARGRKKRTQTTGKRPEQRRGGKGTNGPPEPTYAAKRTWQKQSTHLNPTTHYGEAQGKKLGTEWGLVGDGRETTKTMN